MQMNLFLCLFIVQEKDEFGVSIEDLLKKIDHRNGKIIKDKRDELENNLLERQENHVYLFMGAGNISSAAHEFAEKLQEKGIN